MRIVTLISGAEALEETLRLDAEIRSFNAGIDFRLRFLHVEIEPSFAADAPVAASFRAESEKSSVVDLTVKEPLVAAAALALLLARERPALLLVVGAGPLLAPAEAAARASGTRLAYFGSGRGSGHGGIDLGEVPSSALDRLTGVAREIH